MGQGLELCSSAKLVGRRDALNYKEGTLCGGLGGARPPILSRRHKGPGQQTTEAFPDAFSVLSRFCTVPNEPKNHTDSSPQTTPLCYFNKSNNWCRDYRAQDLCKRQVLVKPTAPAHTQPLAFPGQHHHQHHQPAVSSAALQGWEGAHISTERKRSATA